MKSALRFFMAYVMYQTSWSVLWLFFMCFAEGCWLVGLFYSNSLLPHRSVQELGFLILRANLDTVWL